MSSRKSYLQHAIYIALLVAVLSGCDRFDGSDNKEVESDPLWRRYVTAHTSGIVSRHTDVRILFSSDVAVATDIGKSASHLLSISPKIVGSAVFADPREISITLEEPLQTGKEYRVQVKPPALLNFPKNLDPFEFRFNVLEPDFDVTVSGLTVSDGDEDAMVLNGAVEAADAEDAQAIESVVTAQLGGSDLEIVWSHLSGGRRHEFTIAGIARDETSRLISVTWNGNPIGADKRGERQVEVPARAAFELTQLAAEQEPSPHLTAVFSDNIDSQQQLKGLIATSQGVANVRIEGNVLKIFPEKSYTGELVVTFYQGIRNTRGKPLSEDIERTVNFSGEPPQVRFVGKGAILPQSDVLSIPFEAVNVRSVEVKAFRIWESNIGQFLQTNELDGASELHRVGREIWTKTIHLPTITANARSRFNLDVSDLLRLNPDGMFQLSIFVTRANSTYPCSIDDKTPDDISLSNTQEGSYNLAPTRNYNWQDRGNPCTDGYFHYAKGARDTRNLLASNIGLLGKRDSSGMLHVVATNIRTAEPMQGVKLTLYDYQNQPRLNKSTDEDGFAVLAEAEGALYVLAEYANEKGYLRLQSALPVSHFDVGGEVVSEGVKGLIYGERGVWRPGDDIHLTFVLQDQDDTIPPEHPVTMTLRNPQGQLIQTVTNSKPVGNFYSFSLSTDESAPTGNWTARAELGRRQFAKTLKIETVRPDRLKVETDVGGDILYPSDMPLRGTVDAQWLHGGIASQLKSDVTVLIKSVPTRFNTYKDYVFDDPARHFSPETRVMHDGQLDENGQMVFKGKLLANIETPGAVQAQFTSRVFERSGAFSSRYTSSTYYPYDYFVGVRLPEVKHSWNTLSTAKTHKIAIATVDARGKAASREKIRVSVYLMDWLWWWDRSRNSVANFATSRYQEPVQEVNIDTKNGKGEFNLRISSTRGGRYLLRACDLDGGHCSGRIFYASSQEGGRSRIAEGGEGANVLSFFSDKDRYSVGETAVIQLPDAIQGRALVTIENGTGLLDKRWVEMNRDKTSFEVPVTAEMSPNVYVSVSLIQPHAGKDNDRPIRLYGVIPLFVDDPTTRLAPIVEAADEWRPETRVVVEVGEENGREMTYTLAVVDEGLLTLTSYKTPDLRGHFYKREALGVRTWDVFDYVVGAYGGELDRLLAIGGDEGLGGSGARKERRRFPPVVTYLGPFKLKAKTTQKHEIELPQYIGAVRVMVVAGDDRAYGSADKSVSVRQPLSLLATLPRVLGPDEEVTLPVSLFVMDPSIRDVTLRVEVDDYFDVIGSDTTQVHFDKPGEEVGMLRLKVRPRIGTGHVRLVATSGTHKSHADIDIDIRSANPLTVRTVTKALKPGETWTTRVVPHGLQGSNETALEVYSAIPFPLTKHLTYLMRYPHGCVEQTISSVFPQLYLPKLTKLDDVQTKEVEQNIRAGINRLRLFQRSDGGFSYWPGLKSYYNRWASTYAGHFLVEAQQAGYFVPKQMILKWAGNQKSIAESWREKKAWHELDQAYRLYALSLAGRPVLGAMNRLRERKNTLSPSARVLLAAAYKKAGQAGAAADLIADRNFDVSDYAQPGFTYGSVLRDKGLILSALVQMDELDTAIEIARDVSAGLAEGSWHSTHTVAQAISGMGRLAAASEGSSSFKFEKSVGKSNLVPVTAYQAVHRERFDKFPDEGEDIQIRNTSDSVIYAYVVSRGSPPSGEENAVSKGFDINVKYTDRDGKRIDVSRLTQNADVIADVAVTNRSYRSFQNVALSHIMPSGWEIHNERMAFNEPDDPKDRVDYRDIRDDRVYAYFGIRPGQTRHFKVRINAAFLGRYFLPAIKVEPMYDATRHAATTGQWIEIASDGQ